MKTLSVGGEKFTYLKKGKVKEVYEGPNNRLLFYFTNQISVFDKIIPVEIPKKGEYLCRGTTYWFEKVANNNICNTHFISMPESNQMVVLRANIVEKPIPTTQDYFIPLEFICRHYAAGSLVDRIKEGKMKPEDVGLTSPPKLGDKLPEPFFEATTKFEKFDRHLSINETLQLVGLRKEEFEEIKETVLKIDEMIAKEVESRGLIHVDGKKEFAFHKGGLMLVDTFGTGDEDRFWTKADYVNGQLVEMSKEFARQYFKRIGYHAELTAARDKGEEEPEIPALPMREITVTAQTYQKLHKMLTGEDF